MCYKDIPIKDPLEVRTICFPFETLEYIKYKYISDIIEGRTLLFAEKRSEYANTSRPLGYWTKNDGANMRLFLDEFAKTRNLDPLNPNDWYSVKANDIISVGVCIASLVLHNRTKIILGLRNIEPL